MNVPDVGLTTRKLRAAADLLTRRKWTKQALNHHFGGPMVLEGLISKGYAELVSGDDAVYLTLAGTKFLLDAEGIKHG